MRWEITMRKQQPTVRKPAVRSSDLLAALDRLEANWNNLYIDQTVQWAINELSDEAHAHVFGAVGSVVEEYGKWKAANK